MRFASVGLSVGLVGISALFCQSVRAAERLTLRFGLFEQTVSVGDVESYARTGQVPDSMGVYRPFLNDGVRRSLNAKLDIDPKLGSKVVEDLMRSPTGKQVLATLLPAVPGLSAETLQAGLTIAAKQFNGLDAVRVLRAIPQDTITVDVTEAIGIASKINFNYLKTQAMGAVLRRGLTVENATFKSDFDAADRGVLSVNRETQVMVDADRKRQLPVDIYSPDLRMVNMVAVDRPLIVITPGYEANKNFLAYLGEHLASHGFTVVAIEHPSVAIKGQIQLDALIPAEEVLNRPKDISFVLDSLAQQVKQRGNQPDQVPFNTQQVMVIGHSLGGYSALALAGAELRLDELRRFCDKSNVLDRVPADWLQCSAAKLKESTLSLRDRRVKQVMALNPAIGNIFGKAGLAKVETPTLVFSSSEDVLTPALGQQLQPFLQLPMPKYLMTAIGGTHLSVSDPSSFNKTLAQSTLVKEKRGEEMAPLRQALKGVTLAYAAQMTVDGKRFLPFLTPGYVQGRSTAAVGLRLNQNLPGSVTKFLELAAR
jgi:predicted dienelactone hydrolase